MIGCVAGLSPLYYRPSPFRLRCQGVRGSEESSSSSQQPSRWKVLISCYSCGPAEPQGAELLMELSLDGHKHNCITSVTKPSFLTPSLTFLCQQMENYLMSGYVVRHNCGKFHHSVKDNRNENIVLFFFFRPAGIILMCFSQPLGLFL